MLRIILGNHKTSLMKPNLSDFRGCRRFKAKRMKS